MAALQDLEGMPSFGRYEPRFRIAAGGMAEVYGALARGEEGFERWIALKRMLRHVSEDPRFEEMFLEEGRLAAQIVSPNVVATLDLGRASDGSAFLVMDLVVGATLSQIFRSARDAGGMPVDIATEILVQAARGLHDAHEARGTNGDALDIVHRDVSPQNILVGIDGRARISDFGIARAAQRESHTRTGEVKGKLAYFSPEQAAADEVDRRTDVFSLGIVAWEVLAQRRLFHADNPLGVLKRVVELPIPRLDTLVPAISRELADAVARALERDRDARWPTAAAFAAAMSQTIGVAPDVGAYVALHAAPTVERIQAGMRAAPVESRVGPVDAPTLTVQAKTVRAIPSARTPASTPAPALREVGGGARLVWISLACVLILGASAFAVWEGTRAPPAAPAARELEPRDPPLAMPHEPSSTPAGFVPAASAPVVIVATSPAPPAAAVDHPRPTGHRARSSDVARAHPTTPAASADTPAQPPTVTPPAASTAAIPVPPPSTGAPRHGLLGADDFERTLRSPAP